MLRLYSDIETVTIISISATGIRQGGKQETRFQIKQEFKVNVISLVEQTGKIRKLE